MTAPSHRSFDTAVPLEAPQDLVGFEASHPPAAIAVRRRLPFGLVLSFVFVALLIAASIAPSLFTHFDPLVGDFSEGLKPPGWAHLFGTDRLGRDVFARTVFGTRYSLLIGFGGVAVGLGAGIVLGIIAGQRNRILDEAVSRLFDMLSSFPGVLLAMLIVTFLGQGMLNIAIAVGIAGIPKFGRVVRAQTQLIRDADYVTQAAIYGLSRWQVFIRHVLPERACCHPDHRDRLYRLDDPDRIRPELPRARTAAADAGMGRDAGGEPGCAARRLVAWSLPGPRHHRDGDRLQRDRQSPATEI